MDQGPNILGHGAASHGCTCYSGLQQHVGQVLPADYAGPGRLDSKLLPGRAFQSGTTMPTESQRRSPSERLQALSPTVPLRDAIYIPQGSDSPVLHWCPLDGIPLTTTGQDMLVTPPSGVGLVIDLFTVDFYVDVHIRLIVDAMGLS